MKILSIGRDDDCTITLSDTLISRRHAILKIHATGKMEIVDIGQNGTYVNGIKLSSNVPYPVSRKDVISFAHKKQLDWSQVPDNFRIYRYALWCLIIAASVAGVIFLMRHITITPETQPPAGSENTPVEVVTPPVSAEKPKEEGEKEGTQKGENKEKDTNYVFPKEKEEKEEEENKEKKIEAEESPKETMPLL